MLALFLKRNPERVLFWCLGLFFLMLALCSCSSSSSDDTPCLSFKDASITPNHVTPSTANAFDIFWDLDLQKVRSYRLSIYLSDDATLDDEDTLLYQGTYTQARADVYLPPGEAAYETLVSGMPNKYCLIFKAEALDAYGDPIYTDDHKPLTAFYYAPYVLASEPKKWTVMVYMAGDNSLSGNVGEDLGEMSAVGSSQDVNIVALADTSYAPAKLYYVEKGRTYKLQDYGELNMADPQNLIDFANFVFEVYPAEHYLLVLWDHGWGFEPPRRDLLLDEDPINTWMDVPTLRQALKALGRRLDIVGFDACLMGMLEVAYEIRDTAFYMVASENYEWASGWDYQRALSPLVNNPNLSPKDLACALVAAFASEYDGEQDSTLAAVNLAYLSDIKQGVDNLVSALEALFARQPETKAILTGPIFNAVQRFDDGLTRGMSADDDSYADLYDLVQLIATDIPSVADEANALLQTLDQAVIANWYSSASVDHAHGLSIWFPSPDLYGPYEWDYVWAHYLALAFAKDSSWPALLQELWDLP